MSGRAYQIRVDVVNWEPHKNRAFSPKLDRKLFAATGNTLTESPKE